MRLGWGLFFRGLPLVAFFLGFPCAAVAIVGIIFGDRLPAVRADQSPCLASIPLDAITNSRVFFAMGAIFLPESHILLAIAP